MNRKLRKKRKMQLKKIGRESFIPEWNSIITCSSLSFPEKLARKMVDGKIQCGKMRGYEFTRVIQK